jgi:hypothetical protein
MMNKLFLIFLMLISFLSLSQVNKKPQLSYGNYYTNNVFINTLNQNPYVNDLQHQKNVQYDDYKLFK